MRIAPEIRLTTEERATLKQLVRIGNGPARVQTRAHIVLMAAQRSVGARGGERSRTNSNQAIAESLQLCSRTVSRVRQAFVQGGLQAALYDKPRVGRPPVIDGEAQAKLVMLACSAPPEGRSRWTLQLLADRMVELGYVQHISDTWVMKRLKKTDFDPGVSRAGAYPK
ncbi:MAG: helix-turn-helix domain-containing protein, partial [Chloroflexota bacterium]